MSFGTVVRRMSAVAVVFALVTVLGAGGLSLLNRYQTRGALRLPGLTGPVLVRQDEKGMSFIRADTISDLLFAQGFVTARDRLFQMHLIRLLIQGRTSELAGDPALDQDIRMRTIGLSRLARQQAAMLHPGTAALFQKYADGVNAFMKTTPEALHLEFRLAGITPEPWTVTDSLSLMYFLGFATAADLDTEIILQMLLRTVGYEKTCRILPLNIHPDDTNDTGEWSKLPAPDQLFRVKTAARPNPHTGKDAKFTRLLTDRYLRTGSNNWAVSGDRTATGRALLCGDTHLDPRMLPGVWYPVGLISRDIRAVGVNIPGIPGMAMGRTRHIALAMTNNYADLQDLFLVRVDPDHPGHYLDNGRSRPFDMRREILTIKDTDAPDGFRHHEFTVQSTHIGPVVTGLLDGLAPDTPVAQRFAPAESMIPDMGLLEILTAENCPALKQALTTLPMISMNWVFADVSGSIGYQVSGRVPIRKKGHGTFLRSDTAIPLHQEIPGKDLTKDLTKDPWLGWIPVDDMPGTLDPPSGWIGTCNHKTVRSDFPYYYSSYFAPRYRYDRLSELMAELMAEPAGKTAAHMWRFQRDVLNPMARTLAPVMARILRLDQETRALAEILESWDFRDDPASAAPAVFQAVYLCLAAAVFEDELGPDLTGRLLNTWYFWQERLQQMILTGRSDWFDDIRTPDRSETLSDLLVRAGRQAKTLLTRRLGPETAQWQWGRLHTLTLVSPLAKDGWLSRLLGTGPLPMGGSGETLYRGWYDATDPFAVTHCAALRMVVDFADKDKIMAVIPGGVTGRMFHPHHKDRVKAFMSEDPEYWWFSDEAVNAHTVTTQVLIPGG
ncbi:MAG: penicillin acylase family protein [Desulfotignum sp.]|nr:penicillin acylase family protein [Desulfotignum sp.]